MDFLWSSPKKLEGSDNNGGSTISSCVEQLKGGISDILSFENILESTASSLEDDEDENELEDESLLQDGSVKTCSVDEDGDVCRSVSQTKEELSGSVQPAITDSTEPVSDHKHTQIQADNDDTEEDNEAVQNNKDLRPSDNTTAVLQHSLTSQQSRESTNENSAPTQTPDVTRDTFPGNILKGDRGLVSDSNGVNKGEALATEFVSTEEEVSTTSSDTNTAQSEAANPTNTFDDTINLPQQHISSEAARFPKDTVQQEMLDHDHDHDVGSNMPQDESDGSSAAMSLKLGGEDVLESGACSPCPDISTTEVSTTESEGDSNKARESKSSHVLQMMETVVKEDVQQYNTSSQSVLDIAAHISSSDSDNALHRGKVPQQNTDTVGPLSSTPVQSTDQQDTPVPGDPEGGETAPPRAPATVQGDREESKGAPIIGEQYQHQQQQVSSTEPEPQSLTEPPLKEPELWNRQSGYQSSDPASLATVPLVLPAPESASLHPESVHASHENLPSALTAQDSAAVGQEVTSMEQKGEETSSADDPSRDAPQVNGDKELEQQPITEQQDKPASEELSHQPITAQLIKGELGEAMTDKKEPELELEVKEDNEESGDDDAREDSRTQSALSSQSLEGMVSTDDQPSRSKYNTVCYRKIKRGNTKQRIDEFESMMNF